MNDPARVRHLDLCISTAHVASASLLIAPLTRTPGISGAAVVLVPSDWAATVVPKGGSAVSAAASSETEAKKGEREAGGGVSLCSLSLPSHPAEVTIIQEKKQLQQILPRDIRSICLNCCFCLFSPISRRNGRKGL
jgi:hypothetical protein